MGLRLEVKGVPLIVRWLRSIGQVLFPAKCINCRELFQPSKALLEAAVKKKMPPAVDFTDALARYFCSDCRKQWTAVTSPLCSRCGLVFKSRQGEDHLCGRCLDHPGAFTKARSVGIYDDALKVAIHTLKFKGHRTIAQPLGEILLYAFHLHWAPEDIDLIAPVPLHRRRFRERGFNQAYLLIRRWPLPDNRVLVKDLLVRTRATASQTGLNRKQRKTNIKRAFAVKRTGQSKGKRILLVDDVLTTGETADACARALLGDGARRVDVLTLARAT